MQPSEDKWWIVVRNKLEEFRVMWQHFYLDERRTGVNISKLQRATGLIAQQLTTLLGASNDVVDAKNINMLTGIAELLYQLSEFTLRLGDEPLKNFNEIGDNAIISINELMQSANALQTIEKHTD